MQQTPFPQPTAASQSRSVWDGVYTEKQAQRGEALYHEDCSTCHGENLNGKTDEDVPPLTGGRFSDDWSGRTVGDLFKKILRTMPQDDPGRLDAKQSVDALAYILSFNKFPAGELELPVDEKMLSQIQIQKAKPDRKKSVE